MAAPALGLGLSWNEPWNKPRLSLDPWISTGMVLGSCQSDLVEMRV